jgi:hypothetical protein
MKYTTIIIHGSGGVILNLMHGVQQYEFMIKELKEVKLQNREVSV